MIIGIMEARYVSSSLRTKSVLSWGTRRISIIILLSKDCPSLLPSMCCNLSKHVIHVVLRYNLQLCWARPHRKIVVPSMRFSIRVASFLCSKVQLLLSPWLCDLGSTVVVRLAGDDIRGACTEYYARCRRNVYYSSPTIVQIRML